MNPFVPYPPTRDAAVELDRRDALAPLREQFLLPDELIYLDGNSLGALPRATPQRLQQVVQHEWGQGLIGSWNQAGWIELPQRVGDKIARLVGAAPGELVVADSTSVNLYKVLHAAASLPRGGERRRIVSERSNFPTDLYIAQAVAAAGGLELVLADAVEDLPGLIDERLAVLMLTHVNYRTGAMHDMAGLSAAAHAAGGLTVWDLAHSAGAVPVDLHAAQADFAVGCGYKYLNGGPGAPAFVWVHPRHVDHVEQPLSGWMGHAQPFAFAPRYRRAGGIAHFLCGTPALLSLAALECGVDTLLAAQPLGGMTALREKSLALTRQFVDLLEARCAGHGLRLVTPREDARRASQVCLAHDAAAAPAVPGSSAHAIVQALIARGVVGDFRAGDDASPDILRFGFTPLTLRFADVWDAVEQMRQVLETGEWRNARFQRKAAVT